MRSINGSPNPNWVVMHERGCSFLCGILTSGGSEMDDKVRFQIDNLSEFKKQTQLAESQLNQLKQTLELIEDFKIQVSFPPKP